MNFWLIFRSTEVFYLIVFSGILKIIDVKMLQKTKWKRVQKSFSTEDKALRHYDKNYKGRGDIERYQIKPTNFGNYNLWIESNGIYG